MDPREVSAALLSLGYGDGREGVIAFQRDNKLVADGIAGPITRAALQAAVIAKGTAAAKVEPVAINLLTPAIIRAVAPSARQDIVDIMVGSPDQFAAARIVSKRRMAHFLTQTAVESAGFKALEENLNYSAHGLVKTFKKYFPTLASTAGFVGNPRAIANKVYGGRLGNHLPNDGWDYRGGGILQNTGRTNYRAAGFEDDPQVLRMPAGALSAALHFWSANGLNDLADSNDVRAVRKRVNGGTNGLDDAIKLFPVACKALGI